MGSMHSLFNNLVVAGSLYGWRIDALLVGSLLWAATTSSSQLRFAMR